VRSSTREPDCSNLRARIRVPCSPWLSTNSPCTSNGRPMRQLNPLLVMTSRLASHQHFPLGLRARFFYACRGERKLNREGSNRPAAAEIRRATMHARHGRYLKARREGADRLRGSRGHRLTATIVDTGSASWARTRMTEVLIAVVSVVVLLVFLWRPKHCRLCGGTVDRSAKVCRSCGYDFAASPPSEAG
jgi:hypothetical protein